MSSRTVAALAIAVLAAGSAAGRPDRAVPVRSVEARPPEAPDQRPAFAGQTRAPRASDDLAYRAEVVARGLEHPWGLAFLPTGELLVTERPGRMRIVGRDGALSEPVRGLLAVDARDQGGLLDVALDPEFAGNALVYWSFAEPRRGGVNATAVARGRLERGDGPPRIADAQVIWRMRPAMRSTKHFGGRLVFARDRTLFVTTGERSIRAGRVQAQLLDSTLGKIVRIYPDGRIPRDNPFVGRAGARPEVWSYGHRNVQAAALHPRTGQLWIVEHGARGGDELNRIEPGANYGWPVIAYGVEYSGAPIGEGRTQLPGMEQPIYYWDPVIAPSGMAFYDGALFPAWRGDLFVGALAGRHVARLELDGGRVTGEQRLLVGRGRIRDVRVGPDGAIYVLTDEARGEIVRLVPARAR